MTIRHEWQHALTQVFHKQGDEYVLSEDIIEACDKSCFRDNYLSAQQAIAFTPEDGTQIFNQVNESLCQD